MIMPNTNHTDHPTTRYFLALASGTPSQAGPLHSIKDFHGKSVDDLVLF